MRLLVYNTEGKIFGKLSIHVETQSAGPQNNHKSTRSLTIHQTNILTVAQRTEQEILTIMYILRDKYNSSSLTKHTCNSTN